MNILCDILKECVPEDLDLKKKVFGQIDDLMDDDTIVASSSNCLTVSMYAEDFKHRQNMLVAQPVCNYACCVLFVDVLLVI
jgi:L-gulonate 3-dehydrogenase